MSLEKERYADVIVDVTQASIDRSYQYRIPPELENKVRVGCVVRIPFGNGKRSAEGYVLNIGTEPRIARDRIKPILEVPDNRVTIESKLIELALWMKTTYGSSLNNALKTVLPVREKEKHAVREEVSLVWPEKKTRLLLEQYTRRHYAAKVRLLTALLKTNELEKSYVTGTLKITPESLRSLEREGVISVRSADLTRTPDDMQEPEEKEEPCILTPEQSRVCSGILREWEGANRPCLIRGVTGSGKTLVYMDLMEKVLKEGRQVILLIPEIALSWQNVKRFRSRFGDAVTILNSKMSKGERYDQFERLKKGEAQIVIGPRSALFTPFPKLGLIIIDEEQESSYRSENAPRYDARETALERARIENAHVVFGSATPSVDSVFRCREGRYAGFLLESRYGNADLPSVHVEDMREELRHGNRSILSEALREAVKERLERKEQAILFLNRRGYSGFISCRSCGEVIKCPHCDVSLTFHTNGKLVCHYCGYEIDQVSRCPSCGSPYIGGFRAGTEKVEAELHRFFPEARIIRMDADTTRKKDGYARILRSFASGEADILVGTQMIVKGHDFPRVTLVGVLAADLSLFVSDYRAAERTYQLLVQAVGRAGRGDLPGEAYIQTYHPDHYSIRAAAKQDYDAFYDEEMLAREMMHYPPACNLLAIHGSCADEQRLVVAMGHLKRYLIRNQSRDTVIIGPAPENIRKIQDIYRQVLYVKEPDEERIIRLRRLAEKFIEINSGFNRMMFQYDLNA